MKKWISLFDLCPIRPGMRNDRAARITAMSYLRDCPDKEQRMEKQLLTTSEYILLRGKDSYNGLLQMVETNPVSRITGQAIMELYNSVPKSYRKNAVFLMNVVTLNELSRNLGIERDLIACQKEGTFTLMDKPIVLCNAMQFIQEGSVPILFGDFKQVYINNNGDRSIKRLDQLFIVNDHVGFLMAERVGIKLTVPDAVRGLQVA